MTVDESNEIKQGAGIIPMPALELMMLFVFVLIGRFTLSDRIGKSSDDSR